MEAVLRTVEPDLVLTPPWLLQAVIAHELNILPAGLAVPDEQLLVIGRARLDQFIRDRDLPMPDGLEGDAVGQGDTTLILLERPEADQLDSPAAPKTLLEYWRLLARAKVEALVRRAIDDGVSTVQSRIDAVGQDVFNEARQVLTRERRLLASAEAVDVYAKFAAAFIETREFTPRLMPHVFPSIEDADRVAAIIEGDLPKELVQSLRPPGAPDPWHAPYQLLDSGRRPGVWSRVLGWFGSGRRDRTERTKDKREAKARRDSQIAAADVAASRGNDVRAAILRAQAYRGKGGLRSVPTAALPDLKRLAARLNAALGLDEATTSDWQEALRPLLAAASSGWWNAEGRLLYDLQRVCIDHEKEIYTVNVVEWVMELGRRPLYRPLPQQRLALAARRLRIAAHRLTRCRLSTVQRERLEHLLHDAFHSAEHQLRHDLTPLVDKALDDVDLRPQNTVETVGRARMTQELIDAVVHDGYLTFSGVRDAISRNSVRCHDLRTVGEWVGYDQLMKLDHRLGNALDGVYRRGEIYRYLFQKLSSILFANPVGRLLTLTIILPLAGAYLLLEALQHTVGTLLTKVFHIHTHMLPVWKTPDPIEDPTGAAAVAQNFNPATVYTNPWMFAPLVATTLFLFLIINWPAFRRAVGTATGQFFRSLGWLFFELPDRLFKLPFVQRVLRSRKLRVAFRYGFKPLVLVLIAWWILPHDATAVVQVVTFAAIFLLVNLVVNSPPGRAAEESFYHALRIGWVRFTADKIMAFFRGILRFFERMMEGINRMLYAVDEWLRFRDGGGRSSLVIKAVLGVIWFYVAYVFRFALTLLVEPQVNPIKHFPVVTVSHKLLLPLAIPGGTEPSPLGGIIVWLFGASKATADATAATIVWGIPGIFGFLAWELRENWKLYRANRPTTLQPARFGSHGESVAQLLRPGFHSGTLPKAFAKLRKAHRSADSAERIEGAEFPLPVHKHLEAIEHVDEAVRQFVDRYFLALVNRHRCFRDNPVELAGTKLGVTRIVLLLERPIATSGAATPSSGELVRIEFEQVGGWVIAEIPDRGWISDLSPEAARVFEQMLEGFYRMSAVDLVREEVDKLLRDHAVAWDIRPKQLVVRTAKQPASEAAYELYESRMEPHRRKDADVSDLPVLHRKDLLFREQAIEWDRWVAIWEQPASATPPVDRLSAGNTQAVA
ncbi:hypothetical protein [Humisphaera borealis]|uniref:Uncharacterized protein n=1 Tax=Humisphaera borealis TaxID=2807512 RepID=A0A7M2WTH1_9BACT|nr:hypothetical protein [Humisphaera borealis]QOV88729.1 hypothetical protein IPV69_21240 [Humisphaera borealis]